MADNSNKNAANSQFRKLRQAEEGKRAMLDYENSAVAMRAKTTRLRALRMAREAEEATAAAAAPPVKKKAAKKVQKYKTARDFRSGSGHLRRRQPQIFAAHPSLGVSTVAEYVDNAKKNPGVGFASSGVGSNQHVVGLWFAKEAGIKLDHVPYRGAGQAVTDLLAGHVKSAFLGPTSMLPHYKAGTLKFLAQTSAKRAPTLPEIPTMEDAGYKRLDCWRGGIAQHFI